MGEYAKYQGRQIKIGTCENMYYLRADQAHLVQHERGNVDPIKDKAEIRFRFPWPDEDQIEPGAFEPFRAIAFSNSTVPEGVEHSAIQFTASAGYLVSIPCPEGGSASHGLKIHRNGFAGAVKLVQQKHFGGKLIAICECGGCGTPYRLETLEEAKPLIDECERNAKSREMDAARNNTPGDLSTARWWREIAKRIARGYTEGM